MEQAQETEKQKDYTRLLDDPEKLAPYPSMIQDSIEQEASEIEEGKDGPGQPQLAPNSTNQDKSSVNNCASMNFTASDAIDQNSQQNYLNESAATMDAGTTGFNISVIDKKDASNSTTMLNPMEESKTVVLIDTSTSSTLPLTSASIRPPSQIPANSRFQELMPHQYQQSIYNTIRSHWANDRNGFGNIVYLETGTGKTYIAIMLLKYIFSDRFIDYQGRLTSEASSEPSLPKMEMPVESDENLILTPCSDDVIRQRKEDRSIRVQGYLEDGILEAQLKKQKKIVFITPTQNLVEQQAATIEAYTDLCVGRYHGGQKQSNYYGDAKQWRSELAEQDVLLVIANKFYDLLMHGFMHMEEVDLLVFDECHHADQDHPYNLIMRDFWFHEFDPDNPFAVKRPKIVGLTASPIKQKIERNKVQATIIEIMLQNLSNNLYSRFVTIAPNEVSELEKLKIEIEHYESRFDRSLEAVQTIETNLLKKMSQLVQFPAECYSMTEYSSGSMTTQQSSNENMLGNLKESSVMSILNCVQNQVHQEFAEEQDTQVLKFLNGRKQMISLNNDFTKEKLSISSFQSYEDKVLVIFCIIIVKNINNLLLEIGPLAVKAFFSDLKKDLLMGMKSSEKSRKQFGLKSEQAIKIIDQFCTGDSFNFTQNDMSMESVPDKSVGEQSNVLDEDSFQVSDKIRTLIKMLNKSYDENPNVKTIIFVKDRSVAVYLKKLLAGDDDLDNSSSSRADDDENNANNREFISKGMMNKDHFKIGFAMGFKSKNIVNKAYKALNTEKVSMYQDVLGQLPSVRSVKLSQNQLKETLDNFRRGMLNVLIATNVVEEGLDVSTCNQVICLNELLTVKAFIQMKGRARQENSKFIFVCAQEEQNNFRQQRDMFDRVINFMKKITTKTQREVIPERHVLVYRQQQQEEYFEVPVVRSKVTAKQAKLLIEKFCQDFIEKSMTIDPSTKKNFAASDTSGFDASNGAQLNTSTVSSNQTLTTNQIANQIKDLGRKHQGAISESSKSFSSSQSQSQVEQQSAGQVSTGSTTQVTVTADNHLESKPNYVVRVCAKEGTKFFFCVLYFPKCCKDIIMRKQNPEKACVKKRDAENHVALQAVKRLQIKGFLTEHLMTNYKNAKIKEHMPPSPPASSHHGSFFKKNHGHYNNHHGHYHGGHHNNHSQNYNDKGHFSKSSRSMSNVSSAPTGIVNNQPRRTKIISEEEKQMERSKHKKFEQHKKQVTFKAPSNQINEKRFQKPLNQLIVYVFKGLDQESEYPFKSTHDFLGILFDRNFSNPSIQFLMYQEQRAKQKNAEHLNNLVRKNIIGFDAQDKIEQKQECLSIALTQQDCFTVEYPQMAQLSPHHRERLMAAKLQCYHTWLFYYLYSADYKFIKAIFKLKFQFVKVLFAKDFSVIFREEGHQSKKVKERKQNALKMLQKLYFPHENRNDRGQQSYQYYSNSYGGRSQGSNVERQQKKEKRHASYYSKFGKYLRDDPIQEVNKNEVPLLAYSVPVTNRKHRRLDGRPDTQGGNYGMRVDWTTVDRVIEWVRSRIYELCLPTERTHILFKYTIDDPVRSHIPKSMKQRRQQAPQLEVPQILNDKDIMNDMAQMERSYLTGRLWDQRFQGNRFVILDQELIHDSQDKPIDLNQGKKEFIVERSEYQTSVSSWHQDYKIRCNDLDQSRSSRKNNTNSDRGVNMNTNVQEFHPRQSDVAMINTNHNQSSFYDSQSGRSGAQQSFMNQSLATSVLSGLHPEHARSFKTREFYFLKQGIFEHRIFSKYIVKCRKERHFLDFGKKKRDEVLLEEQLLLNNGQLSNSMTRKMMPHGINAKSFNQHTLKSQRQLLQQQDQAKKRTNTEFDILDQMLTLAPITYDQYQVLQTTCYHMLNFNELLMTERFINEVFKDLKCLLTVKGELDSQLDYQPAEASKDILHTFAQLEQIEIESGSQESKGRLVREQLLQNIDLVKEALTSPGACREYDYERLEFYGDSIIGFLVILELFVTQPTMVEGDLDFKRIQKVSNLRFYEVNTKNAFYNYMITESHQVYSGYDHAGFDDRNCTCQTIRQNKTFCTCKRSSCKITQKHQNELQNKLAQLRLIRKRLEDLDATKDPLEQIFMRGNIYQLAEMIIKDPQLEKECMGVIENLNHTSSNTNLNQSSISLNDTTKSAATHIADSYNIVRTEEEKIKRMCKVIISDIKGGPRFCLMKNIDKVITKVESQINQNAKKSNERNKRQKGPFYYKQLADVVESVTGAVTLACGLNCTQDYLRTIGVLEYDQAHLMNEMQKLVGRQKEKSDNLDKEFYHSRNMVEVEKIMGYDFRCKAWLIEALTHKSYSREHEKINGFLEDYERLEFLGDAVLGCLMARHFFLETQKDDIRKNPKELHKMKTSVINNNLLSLIVIENNIHKYMIYNQKAPSFYEQFEKYVNTVHEMSDKYGETKQLVEQKKRRLENEPNNPDEEEEKYKEFDLDTLHEHNLKIFGDVFESLIGAVFLDSQCVETTWKILEKLIEPYVYIYADLATLQDHSRTLLLEMWNQKPYTKNLTCKHKTEELENGEKSRLNGIIVDNRERRECIVYSETFTKDAKSKVRTFYKHFYQLVKKFVDEVDLDSEENQRAFSENPDRVIVALQCLWEKEKAQKEAEENALQAKLSAELYQKCKAEEAAEGKHNLLGVVSEQVEEESKQFTGQEPAFEIQRQ